MIDTTCGLQHNYLSDSILDFTGFSFSSYSDGEKKILTPQLKAKGYTLKSEWFSEDFDSFGPLVRAIDVVTPAGEHGRITYG